MIIRVLLGRKDRALNVLNVPYVQWQWWWGASYVSLSYPVAVHCQKNKNESENSSPRSVLNFRLSHLVAVRQGVCCSYLTSSCKYALFSFLKRRGKDQTVKKLTSQLIIDSGASWHTELTSPTLFVPTCHLATFFVF